MDTFEKYTKAFEAMAYDTDCMYGMSLLHSFIATEAAGSFDIKATLQKYWGKLMALIEKFKNFISEKFRIARDGVRKIINMLKGQRGGDDNGKDSSKESSAIVDQVTKMDNYIDESDKLCKHAEEMAKKLEELARAQADKMDDIDGIMSELDEMVDDFVKKAGGVQMPSMDSNLDVGMEGIGGFITGGARRLVNTLLTADAVMRAVEHLTGVFKTVGEACKRRFDGSHQNDQKFAARIQKVINTVLGILSRIGHGIISLPGRALELIKKARGNRTTTQPYNGPDPIIG